MIVDTDDLLDSTEVAKMTGLSSRGAVAVYLARYPDFPRPVLHKARCQLWLRADIERWRALHPGRTSAGPAVAA